MRNVQIFGLPPGDKDDTIVVIFDAETFNTDNAIELCRGQPDNNGRFFCALSKSFKGKFIELVVLPKQYVHINEKLPVEPLGVFHAVKLRKEDNLYDTLHKYPVEPDEWFRKSQQQMRVLYREAKYKNYGLKIVGALATIGAAFVGWFIAEINGLIIGCLLTIFTILIAGYTSGHEKGI